MMPTFKCHQTKCQTSNRDENGLNLKQSYMHENKHLCSWVHSSFVLVGVPGVAQDTKQANHRSKVHGLHSSQIKAINLTTNREALQLWTDSQQKKIQTLSQGLEYKKAYNVTQEWTHGLGNKICSRSCSIIILIKASNNPLSTIG